jgi:hypothetical protein
MADLDMLLSSAQGGQLAANLAQQFDLSETEIVAAIQALKPALALGLDRAAEDPQGAVKLVECVCAASSCCAHDHVEAACADDAISRGQTAVFSLFGADDATDQILQAASRQSGVSTAILRQLLPILASILFSGLSKTLNQQGLGGILSQIINSGVLSGGKAGGGLEEILGQVLSGGKPASRPGPQPREGGLGGLLGGVLGSILGGGRDKPANRGDSLSRSGSAGGDPLELPSDRQSPHLPGGFDDAAARQAIEKIKQKLQIGVAQNAQRPGAASSELEKLLGQLLGK